MIMKIVNEDNILTATLLDDEGNVIDHYVVDAVIYESRPPEEDVPLDLLN